MTDRSESDRHDNLPTALEAVQAEIVGHLESLLVLLPNDTKTRIVQDLAVAVRTDRLNRLNELETADGLREITEKPRKETRS